MEINKISRETYRRVNYSLRMAKCVERKMILEILIRLHEYENVQNYRYIGFGSTYFSDFKLFHKKLNIKNMISIEKDEENKKRFELNKPFKCIQLEFGVSTSVLNGLEWNQRNIVWLDYDSKIKPYMFEDIALLVSKLIDGSILIFSMNSTILNNRRNRKEQVDEFKSEFERYLPFELKNRDLSSMSSHITIKKMFDSLINETMMYRNNKLNDDKKFEYRQLFNFKYADGAPMITIGGIIVNKSNKSVYDKCKFYEFHFIRKNNECYNIVVPNLSNKEIQYLNTILPVDNIDNIDYDNFCGINEEDVKNYVELYRYYPNFLEVENL